MQTFNKGDKVRKRGEGQIMTIKGKAGLLPSPDFAPIIKGKVICGWTNKMGQSITRIFEIDLLELVA